MEPLTKSEKIIVERIRQNSIDLIQLLKDERAEELDLDTQEFIIGLNNLKNGCEIVLSLEKNK